MILASVQQPSDFAPWTAADTVLVTASVAALVIVIAALSLPAIVRHWRQTSQVIREAEQLTEGASK